MKPIGSTHNTDFDSTNTDSDATTLFDNARRRPGITRCSQRLSPSVQVDEDLHIAHPEARPETDDSLGGRLMDRA